MQTPNTSKVQATDVLNVKNLSSELTTIVNWYELGIKLGVLKHELDIIECDHQGNVQRMSEMLDLWLRSTPNASWVDVVSALKQMGENRVAECIHQDYIRGDSKLFLLSSYNTNTQISPLLGVIHKTLKHYATSTQK